MKVLKKTEQQNVTTVEIQQYFPRDLIFTFASAWLTIIWMNNVHAEYNCTLDVGKCLHKYILPTSANH